uniref:Uncharacterized protein n=1 Tax=Lactuca sativa TaxID=4236 RepID=A0A9R1W529_LACSA|nr:hypothetical protein LSAT_V11C300106770 [Lactuca sativa]
MHQFPDFGTMQGTRSQSVFGLRYDARGKAPVSPDSGPMQGTSLGELPKLRAYVVKIGSLYPIQIDVGEDDLGLALTLYKSAIPEFSGSRGWKHSKRVSSCSKKLNLDWEGGEKTMASGQVDKGKDVEPMLPEFFVFDAEKELNKEIDVNEELDMNKW